MVVGGLLTMKRGGLSEDARRLMASNAQREHQNDKYLERPIESDGLQLGEDR